MQQYMYKRSINGVNYTQKFSVRIAEMFLIISKKEGILHFQTLCKSLLLQEIPVLSRHL